MNVCLPIVLAGLLLASHASAMPLRFFGWPAEVYQGDAVVFTYRDDNIDADAVHLSQLAGWRWDFNGDGIWDEEKTVGDPVPITRPYFHFLHRFYPISRTIPHEK